MTVSSLIQKYNIPGPRYTSYPTVPYWQSSDFTVEAYVQQIQSTFQQTNTEAGISLYIHLPYCESLCTFCACNHRITKKHSVEASYIDSLLSEWQLYVQLLQETGQRIRIRELHLGGGTPTFFAPEQLERLIKGIFQYAARAECHEFGFEGHPNNTSKAHLQTLFDLGFNRVSFGVQDYDSRVQKAINRIQPFEHVASVHQWAREIGYSSISHDLVFGLPHQSMASMQHTIEQTVGLQPDRLAFYSYAHVPWLKGNGQRGFDEADLPGAKQKRALYELGKRLFDEHGYIEVGMDHFALPNDGLSRAMQNGTLHRNFMGYTQTNTSLMIGLGVSAIGDAWGAFGQNEKVIEDYQARVAQGVLPLMRGHILSREDRIVRKHILNLMCRLYTNWQEECMQFEQIAEVIQRLLPMQEDGLVSISAHALEVHESGRPFVRNIAMAFDLRLWKDQPATRLFSMTI